MSKWVDVPSNSFDNEEEEEESNEDSKSQIEEEEEDKDEGEDNNSGSDSEAEIYKATKADTDMNKEEDKDYSSYKPTQSELDEFINQLNIIREVSDKVTQDIKELTDKIDSDKFEIKYGISYYDAKINFLAMYLEQLLSYSELKLKGESIENHPIIKSLIETKAIIEKSKIIDIKLKPQIDRLLSLASDKGNAESNYKSNILDENNNDKDEAGEREGDHEKEDEKDNEEEDNANKEKTKQKMKYEVKKNMIEFFETKNDKKIRRRQIEKDRERIRNSEVIKELREEINDNPNLVNFSNSHYDKFMKEVEQHEDETFQRMTIAKNKLKQLKKRDRKEEDLRYFDKDLKQITNVLLHDNEDFQEEKEQKSKFLQRKREMKKMENQLMSNKNNKAMKRGRGKQNYKKKH